MKLILFLPFFSCKKKIPLKERPPRIQRASSPWCIAPPVWWSNWRGCAGDAKSRTDSSSVPSASAGSGTACRCGPQTGRSISPHPGQKPRSREDPQWTQILVGAPLEPRFPESPGPGPAEETQIAFLHCPSQPKWRGGFWRHTKTFKTDYDGVGQQVKTCKAKVEFKVKTSKRLKKADKAETPSSHQPFPKSCTPLLGPPRQWAEPGFLHTAGKPEGCGLASPRRITCSKGKVQQQRPPPVGIS